VSFGKGEKGNGKGKEFGVVWRGIRRVKGVTFGKGEKGNGAGKEFEVVRRGIGRVKG
jgi:hypothetical protein